MQSHTPFRGARHVGCKRLQKHFRKIARRAARQELQILTTEAEEVAEDCDAVDLRLVDFTDALEGLHVASGNGDVEKALECKEALREILKCEPTAVVVSAWLERVRTALVHASTTIVTAQRIAQASMER